MSNVQTSLLGAHVNTKHYKNCQVVAVFTGTHGNLMVCVQTPGGALLTFSHNEITVET